MRTIKIFWLKAKKLPIGKLFTAWYYIGVVKAPFALLVTVLGKLLLKLSIYVVYCLLKNKLANVTGQHIAGCRVSGM